ncbi:TrmB family transcriptional regulator [Amycolatopsis sp. CA-161197]|uniref:TrmB family transcriptional regulator n=1 Tax=Amycolatopsis sp. CA-161197 TaxID=3239922 RepID=UPI003D8D6126
MWQQLVSAGLDPKEAQFYLAVLELARPTVAEAAERAGFSRTNGYDIAKRLLHRGLVTMTEVGPTGRPAGRGRSVLTAADPGVLLDELATRKQLLDGLVPELRAMRDTQGSRPRVRYLEGESGMRAALFETLEWDCPLLGILSMHDLMAVPGPAVMDEYIANRRRRGTPLRVVRSPERETDQDWPSSGADIRNVRFAPPEHIFTLTTYIGEEAVAIMSSRTENFAMMIESREYARTQANLFEVLWTVSTPTS